MSMPRGYVVEYGEKRFTTDPLSADSNILDFFTFPLIRGDKKTALKNPNNVIISEELAEKLFGGDDPMGKILALNSLDNRFDCQISGIMKNIPYNSHLRFDFLKPSEQTEIQKESKRSRRRLCVTYLLLDRNADPEELEKKFPNFILNRYGKRFASQIKIILQPLISIHLHSDLDLDEIVLEKGNVSTSYSLSAVALIILLIACINL